METRNPVSTANIGDHPIHPMLIPFPIAFLVATFAATSPSGGRERRAGHRRARLLGAALIMAALAAIAGLTDFLGDKRIRDLSAAWHHMIGNVIAVLLSLWNWYLRYSGGEAAVLPWGFVLSLIVVAILLYTGWRGWEMVYKHKVAVFD